MNYEKYMEWMTEQPEEFTTQIWKEGYGEGLRQSKDGKIDFPNLMANKPDINPLLKKLKEEEENNGN